MIGRNLTHNDWLRLFGIGMGLFTIGAMGILIGIQGPISGMFATSMLALSIPFMLTGAVIVTAPAVINTIPTPDTDGSHTDDTPRISSGRGPTND